MGGHYLVIVVNLPLIEGRRAKFMVRRSFNPPPPPPSTPRTLTFFPPGALPSFPRLAAFRLCVSALCVCVSAGLCLRLSVLSVVQKQTRICTHTG